MRALMLANPLAPASHVRDALRPWGIEISAETARRDQRFWGLPSPHEQRVLMARGYPPVAPVPAFGTTAHRAIGVLQNRALSTREVADALGTSPSGVSKALKTSALFNRSSDKWSLKGGPSA